MSKKMKTILIVVLMLNLVGAMLWFLHLRSRTGDEVIVLCGGSMRGVMTDIIERYKAVSDDPVVGSFGGSGELCAQIQNTGRGDIYVCHDPFMPWAADRGLISEWKTMGYLDIVIITPKGNPKGIQGLEGLATEGVRLGIGNTTYSTSGVITKNILEKVDFGKDIMRNVRVATKGHQQRCNDVAMGALDASIVWGAVARLFEDKLDIQPVPLEYIHEITSATYGTNDLKNVRITVGVTMTAKRKEDVQRFYRFATEDCADVFVEHGFRAEEVK